MGVPGGQEMEEGDCPFCNTTVARFMTDGFINVKLSEDQHKLLQMIEAAFSSGIPCPTHIIDSASHFIRAGIVVPERGILRVSGSAQKALDRIHQPLKPLA